MAKRGQALRKARATKRPAKPAVDLKQENAALKRELAQALERQAATEREALEQQAATAEVLQVINSSPGDLAPVFEAMLDKALRVCEAAFGTLFRYDGKAMHLAANRGMSGEAAEWFQTWVPDASSAMDEMVRGAAFVHIADVADTDAYRSGVVSRLKLVEATGARTALWVALRKEDALLGVIVIYRREVRPFSDKQIALLQNFAGQAVIAMENARLITETREALERQTATAEVLGVINSSPGHLTPVFDAVLDKAIGLCDAAFGMLTRFDGECFQAVALHGVPPGFAEFWSQPRRSTPGLAHYRLTRGENVVQVGDITVDDLYISGNQFRRALGDLGGARTVLWVALRKDDTLLGSFVIYRQEVRSFTDKQIALVQNFAAQAVIAMENARLITETREALEQQTATAEVLQVINSSPGDLAPVFDAMLGKAMRLCEAAFGVLWTYDGEQMHVASQRGVPTVFAKFLARGPHPVGSNNAQARMMRGDPVVHIIDVSDDEAFRTGDPVRRALVELGGGRTMLAVPLRKDKTFLGSFVIYRQEVKPFSDKQIALLQNFAAQAVIAMENARLITETREALEQQTATAEVLQVINSSPGDLAPVFDAMLEKAMHLCEASCGHFRASDGELLHLVAARGVPHAYAEFLRTPVRPSPENPLGRLLRGERVVVIHDAAADELYRAGDPVRRAYVDLGGARSAVNVALVKDDRLLGTLTVYRQEVRPFSDKQIALLKNFAAQAVIAMENARLLGELRQRTGDLARSVDELTATSDVLKIISRSSVDLETVLDTLVETVARLCRADTGAMYRRQADMLHLVAAHGMSEEAKEFIHTHPFAPDRGTLSGRVELDRRAVQIPDVLQDPEYTYGGQKIVGFRTALGIPLLREETLLGILIVTRTRVEPFTDKEIELATTFADQAVIAIENARLFDELRESLEQQQAIADILQVINRSPGDLQPVFDILLDKAMQLCRAAFGALATFDGESFRTAAMRGVPAAYAHYRTHSPPVYGPGTGPMRLLGGERVVHVLDLVETDAYRSGEPNRRALVDLGGARTSLHVALIKDQTLLGTIQIYRQEVRPFADEQIALLESFAAQAVIAMDNARLLGELRERQAELRVTFDNMGDGVAMFDGQQRLAAWNSNFQQILDMPDALLARRLTYADYLRILAERGEFGTEDIEAELNERLQDTERELRLERTRPDGRVIEVRRNAVPGGGFVLIYSDITERKRAEAAISAARDAAETALRELQAAQTSLVHAQKMAALGQLTAGIAHEIKNPLNFVNNFAGLSVELLDELKEAATQAMGALDPNKRAEFVETIGMLTGNLEKIAEHGRRADGIVKSMLQHSRGGSGERQATDLNALVEEALNLAYHGARAQDQSFNITMERDLDRDLGPIDVVPQDVMRVFLNLIGNGFYAANKRSREGDGTFRPLLTVTTRETGEAVEIRVRDNGVGIPPEYREKLFQPFFTTKPTGEGTGLGLSISYEIVTQQHGGTITVDSEEGQFTEFTVRLPRRRH